VTIGRERAAPIVGVLGATGAVGRGIAAALAADLPVRLRLGTRRPAAVGAPDAEVVAVDLTDPAGVAAFCAGCTVVVNAVGPVGGAPAELAHAALDAGAAYLDAGGGETLRAELARRPGISVVGAGVLPGLSGLLPRWLAAGLAPPLALTGYLSTVDRMTAGSAVELLLDLADDDSGPPPGPPLAGKLPFFPGESVAHPYRAAEIDRVAALVPFAEARWYHVHDVDGRVPATLAGLREELRRGARVVDLAGRLVRAVELEAAGRPAFQQLVVEVAGRDGGRVAVLRAAGTYRLTATVTALAVGAVLAGTVPAGAHFAAEVLEPALVERLPGRDGVDGLHRFDGTLAAYGCLEEGVL
jgi:saccharopine dehydrogenase-like protein